MAAISGVDAGSLLNQSDLGLTLNGFSSRTVIISIPDPTSLRGGEIPLLSSDFHTTMTIGGNFFTTLEFHFLDAKRLRVGSISFNYLSIFSGAVDIPNDEEHDDRIRSQCFEESIVEDTNLYRLILSCDYTKVANVRIASDPRFNALFNHMDSKKPLLVYIRASEAYVTNIELNLEKIMEEQQDCPIHKHFRGEEAFFARDKIFPSLKVNKGTRRVEQCLTFFDELHYLFTLAASSVTEYRIAIEEAKYYAKNPHKMIVVAIKDSKDTKYRVFIHSPSSSKCRITPGDVIRILLPGRNNWNEAWSMVVAPFEPRVPRGFIMGYLYRPLIRTKGDSSSMTHDEYKLSCIELDRFNTYKDVVEGNGIRVKLSLGVHAGQLDRQLSCMQSMYQGATGPREKAVADVLVTRSLRDIPMFDVFESVREEFNGRPEDCITNVNSGQRMAIDMCQKAPAGIVLVQGPPGTGKTHLIVEVTAPFLISQVSRRILITSQTNLATDELARRSQEHVDRLCEEYPDRLWVRGRYVVRASANDAQIAGHSHGERSQQRSKPPALKDLKPNNRLSVAYRMLEMAGVYRSGPKTADPEQFQQFRTRYEALLRGDRLNTKECNHFWSLAGELRDYVISHATVVCTTITNVGSDVIRSNMREGVDLILADEMPRCLEADALMLFTSGFKSRGYIIVGDPEQLGPYISSEDVNSFWPQLKMSLQERLQKAGFPFTLLSVQHRMSPNLSRDASDIVYDSQLQDHESTVDHPLATMIAGVNKKQFGIETNKLMLEIPDTFRCHANWTRQLIYNTRYNEYHVTVAINLAGQIADEVPGTSIGILTGYQGQYGLLQAAHTEMVMRSSRYSKIHIHKVDTAQGLEFDFVILDLVFLCGTSVGFFEDKRRLNVASTRAKHGMYIIADATARNTYWVGRSGSEWIGSYMDRWRENRFLLSDPNHPLRSKRANHTPGTVELEDGGFDD